jgi:uncharacterized NAD-dependent epimerase/dehydratase family protein
MRGRRYFNRRALGVAMARVAVLAEGKLGNGLAKTANGLVLHAVRDTVVCVIDSTCVGKDAGEVVAGRHRGIPVVHDVHAALAFDPEALYIGVATIGGVLPDTFRQAIRQALEADLLVVNGLHHFLADDPEFKPLLDAGKGSVWDVRRPPTGLRVADGRVFDVTVPRVVVMGMDCDSGKRMTAVELVHAAQRRGIHVGFVATGQTGCMLGPDAGAVIDRIPADFTAGQVERMVCDVAEREPELIIIPGQASIQHPAYSGVSLAILHGAAPDAVVLQVVPGRKQRAFFAHKGYEIGTITKEIALIEALGTGKVVALAVNGQHTSDAAAAVRAVAAETGLPAVDPLHGDPDELLQHVLDGLAALGRPVDAVVKQFTARKIRVARTPS